MSTFPFRISFAFVFLVVVLPAQAELHQCEGVWTNAPCAGAVEKSLGAEVVSAPGSIPSSRDDREQDGPAVATTREPLAPRLELIRNLRKLNDGSRRAGQKTLSNSQLEQHKVQCNDLTKPYADCLATFNSLSAQLAELNKKQEGNNVVVEGENSESESVGGNLRPRVRRPKQLPS
jgi:hypothetical protein